MNFSKINTLFLILLFSVFLNGCASGVEQTISIVELGTATDAIDLVEIDKSKVKDVVIIDDGGYSYNEIGEYTIIYEVTTNSNQKKTVTYNCKVQDTTSPSITAKQNTIELGIDEEFRVDDYFDVIDNSKEYFFDLNDTEIDTSKPTEFNITVFVADASGNKSNSIDIRITVLDRKKLMYEKAVELQAEDNWQEAAILFGSLGDYEDSETKYKECIHSQAVQYFDLEQYVDAFKLFSSIKFNESKTFINKIADEEKNKIISEVNKLYKEKDYENVQMILEKVLNSSEKEKSDLYQFSVFMNSIQGDYLWWKQENARTNISKDILTKNGKQYILEPYRDYDDNGMCNIEATLNGNKEHRLLAVEEGEIWIINKDIMDDWEVWESPEVFEANKQKRAEYKEKQKEEAIAKAEAQKKREEMAQKEPAIGMTHDEVRYGAWGEPKDINKTTFAWGTTEQWCYSGYRYVYFTNGKVDAIQE
ncbi:MAG: cell envelope integrity protein TolA [Lachnospiraceae bacterium]|nr:cell envelope integrity protein TolA [Lachnospiraceae bacterium]